MKKSYVKIDYNHWLETIDDLFGKLDQDSEPIQKDVFAIATGAEILSGHLYRIAKHAIDTEDDELIQICIDMGILRETTESYPVSSNTQHEEEKNGD